MSLNNTKVRNSTWVHTSSSNVTGNWVIGFTAKSSRAASRLKVNNTLKLYVHTHHNGLTLNSNVVTEPVGSALLIPIAHHWIRS
jgi:hypothetical protein